MSEGWQGACQAVWEKPDKNRQFSENNNISEPDILFYKIAILSTYKSLYKSDDIHTFKR